MSEVEGLSTNGDGTVVRHRRRYDVNREQFLEAWNSSNTISEVCDKLAMPVAAVRGRAAFYKKPNKDGTASELKKLARSKYNRKTTEATPDEFKMAAAVG